MILSGNSVDGPPHPKFLKDFTHLTQKFETSSEYRDLCFDVIANIIDVDPMTLTYNPVIGKIWRLMCLVKTETRLNNLLTKMSDFGQKDQELREWINKSYNSSDVINKIISNCDQQLPFVMLDCVDIKELPNQDSLLSIARAPTAEALKNVQALLTRLVIIDKEPSPVHNNTKEYIPLNCSHSSFFSILSHLLCPGIKFSQKPSILIAMMLFLNKTPVLMDKAKEYLQMSVGKWLDFTKVVNYPEITSYSYQYIKFLTHPELQQFLTKEEFLIYNQLNKVTLVMTSMSNLVELEMLVKLSKNDFTFDIFTKCSICTEMRPISLVLKGKCCVCSKEGEFTKRDVLCTLPNENKSRMVKCRQCFGIYAILRPELLNVLPKCYACRYELTSIKFTCEKCHNQYICNDNKATICQSCTLNVPKLSSFIKIRKEMLFKENPTCLNIDYQLYSKLKLKSIFHCFVNDYDLLMTPVDPQTTILVYNNEIVLNSSQLLEQINSLSGSQHITCMLCFEDIEPTSIDTACGICDTMVCNDCISTWYGNIKPGNLINLSYISCPFCKNRPKGNILSKYNKDACLVKGLKKFEFLSTHYYGWCYECYEIKTWMTRECGNAMMPIGRFTCEDCQLILEERDREAELLGLYLLEIEDDDDYTYIHNLRYCTVKFCPNCTVAVMKVGGCDHITCQCGTHFCWICLEIKDSYFIYAHLREHYSF